MNKFTCKYDEKCDAINEVTKLKKQIKNLKADNKDLEEQVQQLLENGGRF